MGLVKNSSGCGREELFTSGEEWALLWSILFAGILTAKGNSNPSANHLKAAARGDIQR